MSRIAGLWTLWSKQLKKKLFEKQNRVLIFVCEKKQTHQFCQALLHYGIHRRRAMDNFVMSLSTELSLLQPLHAEAKNLVQR